MPRWCEERRMEDGLIKYEGGKIDGSQNDLNTGPSRNERPSQGTWNNGRHIRRHHPASSRQAREEDGEEMIEWQEATCPECGGKFKYIKGGYRPMTCSKFECIQKHLHPEIRRRKS